MILTELFDPAIEGYQSTDDDNSQQQSYNMRKTRLTLMQLNKMRNINDVRNYEMKVKLKSIQAQYGAQAESDEPF